MLESPPGGMTLTGGQGNDWYEKPLTVSTLQCTVYSRQEHRKAEIAIRPDAGFRGYQGMGANVTRYDGGFQRDMHEALDLYREEDPALVKVPHVTLLFVWHVPPAQPVPPRMKPL